MMSSSGSVAAGSAVAIMQSIGAAGLGAAALPLAGAGAVIGGSLYGGY